MALLLRRALQALGLENGPQLADCRVKMLIHDHVIELVVVRHFFTCIGKPLRNHLLRVLTTIATGRRVDLGSFGPTNAAVFARIMASPGHAPEFRVPATQ